MIKTCLLALFSVIQAQKISYIESLKCQRQLENKFGTLNNAYGYRLPSLLQFTGDIVFISNTLNFYVRLRYQDNYFQDSGITEEDGKSPETTCAYQKLWICSNRSFSDPIQITNLSIIGTNDPNKHLRYLSFAFFEKQIESQLIQSSNSKHNIYSGYYILQYYEKDNNALLYQFFFSFSIAIDKLTKMPLISYFKPLNDVESENLLYFNQELTSEIAFCTDSSCKNNSIQNPLFHEYIYLSQKVSCSYLKDFYLNNTIIYLTAPGLLKQIQPISIDNSVKGQVIIQLKVDVVWRDVTIEVISYLVGVRSNQVYDPINGKSKTIDCIKLTKKSNNCATCEEELKNNGFGRKECQITPENEHNYLEDQLVCAGLTLFIILVYHFARQMI